MRFAATSHSHQPLPPYGGLFADRPGISASDDIAQTRSVTIECLRLRSRICFTMS
jgi:hypothetical protein